MTHAPGGDRPARAAEGIVPFAQAVRLWAKVGLLGFGGPAGQIALMHRLVVDERRWLGERRFLHALNYCNLLPGPEAQQLATYIGWLLHGVKGGVVAGVLFVLPGALIMGALSAVYALYADLTLVQAIFFGIKCVVLAIVLQAIVKVAARALSGPLMWVIAGAAFVALFAFQVPFPLVIAAAALVGLVLTRQAGSDPRNGAAAEDALVDRLAAEGRLDHTRPHLGRTLGAILLWGAVWLGPVAALVLLLGPDHVLSRLAIFFSQMAVVTFGGAYAVLAYVAQEAVATHGWLQPEEMMHGLGLAGSVPGPLILVLEYVGFLAAFRENGLLAPVLAGLAGAMVTLWVTFAPSFLWIFAGAPYAEAVRQNRALAGALAAITAAVVGVIANLALWFGIHVLFREVGTLPLGPVSLPLPDPASLDMVALGLSAAAVVAVVLLRMPVLPAILLGAASGVGLMMGLPALAG